MATSLINTTPQATYESLLKLGDNSALSASLKRISDGAGNDTPIEISTSAVQFGGSTGMYWDNTNRRLGINNNAPSRALTVSGGSRLSDLNIGLTTSTSIGNTSNIIANWGTTGVGVANGAAITPTATFQVRGAGATSATTALRVENSAGTAALTVNDAGAAVFTGAADFQNIVGFRNSIDTPASSNMRFVVPGGAKTFLINKDYSNSPSASALLQVDATTQGFLPPRMTTTQKNAIASPAAGLVVYDTTTNKLCCYDGTIWNDLF